MEYRSKYKAEEIEAILDAKNNTGEGVDSNLDEMFTAQLQTKEVEVSEDTTIKADEGFLGLKEVSVKVSGGGDTPSGGSTWQYFSLPSTLDPIAFSNLIFVIATFMKLVDNGSVYYIGPAGISAALGAEEAQARCIAIGIDKDVRMLSSVTGNTLMSLAECEAQSGQEIKDMFAFYGITEITEEEFYTL